MLREEPDLAGVGGPQFHRQPVVGHVPAGQRRDHARTGPAAVAIEAQVCLRPTLRRTSLAERRPMRPVDTCSPKRSSRAPPPASMSA